MRQDVRVGTPTDAPLSNTTEAQQDHRPRAVTFVAGLAVVEGIVAGMFGVLLLSAWWFNWTASPPSDPRSYLSAGALLGISGGGMLIAAVGLFRLRPWAWTLAMATQSLTLTVSLYEYLSNDPDYLVMSLGVLAVLLLNRQEVRLAFSPPEHPHG